MPPGLRLLMTLATLAACADPRPPAPAHRAWGGRGRQAELTAEVTTRFASRLSAAYHARDPAAAAALYAEDAVAERAGEPEERAEGRPAIERALARRFSRYRDLRLVVGRIWVGREASVIEHVLGGTRRAARGKPGGERPVGVVGAFVVTFDGAGRVAAQRLYMDEVTLIGQIDRRRLPDGMSVPEVATGVADGNAVRVARGTPAEQRNRETSARIWAALTAHRVDDALAPMADDYLYVDFAAPTPLDRAATRTLVTRFFAAVPDLVFAEPPVVIAAGDEVVTEVVEHATWNRAPITLHAVDVRRFAGGQVAREWQYSNYREVLTQLGPAPPPAPAD